MLEIEGLRYFFDVCYESCDYVFSTDVSSRVGQAIVSKNALSSTACTSWGIPLSKASRLPGSRSKVRSNARRRMWPEIRSMETLLALCGRECAHPA